MESEENQVNFYFGIITAMLAFLIITGGFILVVIRYQKRLLIKQRELLRLDAQYKKELLLSSIQSAEAERMQIAKDVHDEIGSIFSTLSLSVNRLKDGNLLQAEHIDTSRNLIQLGINSVRRISHAIVPFELELLGLEQTLENHFDTIRSVSDVSITFKNEIAFETLDKMPALALYRIFQELLSNCIKHAKASHVDIKIEKQEGQMAIEYHDDGIGAELQVNNSLKGIGLKNIESRVLLMNGTVNMLSGPGEGFTCNIIIPLTNNNNI